jgi:acetyltransferase-like isoleucine patch superfamily enzyme
MAALPLVTAFAAARCPNPSLEIGDHAFVGGDAVVIGHVGESGILRIRPVRIGARCTVGQSWIVFPGATMEEGAVLGALSLLPKGTTPGVERASRV